MAEANASYRIHAVRCYSEDEFKKITSDPVNAIFTGQVALHELSGSLVVKFLSSNAYIRDGSFYSDNMPEVGEWSRFIIRHPPKTGFYEPLFFKCVPFRPLEEDEDADPNIILGIDFCRLRHVAWKRVEIPVHDRTAQYDLSWLIDNEMAIKRRMAEHDIKVRTGY